MSYSMGATPKASSSQPFLFDNSEIRTIKIAHERVQLDVNMSTHQIKGVADVILIPLVQNLDYITLDCKDMKINDVWVENRRCENYIHDNQDKNLRDKYMNEADDVLLSDNSIEQSQFFREKFADLTQKPDEIRKSQLIIKVPSSIRITLQDADSLSNYTPITPSVKGTPAAQDSVFTPLTVKIEYELNNPHTGIIFDTALENSPHLWNVFTTSAEFCTNASYWMPCINMLDEKSTWEIEISVPRKVKDIGTTKRIGQKEENANSVLIQNTKKYEKSKHNKDDEDEDEDDEDIWDEVDMNNPLNRDILVCCSEYSTMKEFAHPTDISKKVFAFQIFNPVAPPHIGWAIGAFDYIDLPTISNKGDYVEEEHDENDENGNLQTAITTEQDTNDDIPIRIYTLPTKDIDEKMIINSTLVCQKIMDFYSKDFGSYPFASYSLIFLPTVIPDTMDFASLTVCNTRLLYPTNVIDSMFSTTDRLAWSLANQWSGVNITPNDLNDTWCCIGMAGFMVFQVIKKLYGNNELKYRLKLYNEAIVDQDWEMQPLGTFFSDFSRPISITSGDLDFIRLKAPMVLYILDKRMTKTERSFGMSRVLPKIFLQAMCGDLPNNSLTARHFQHVCERVNKNKLESFFQQWIYGSGVPIFRVTQRFNKKRMVIELGIRQCQAEELGENRITGSKGFTRSALNRIENPYRNTEPYFTGSMTIRINEVDGTPYEHIVEINDIFTKIDIQYNTKFRRNRGRGISAVKSTSNMAAFMDDHGDDGDDYIIRLGGVLNEPDECRDWNLTPLHRSTEGHEMQVLNEAYEWIRIDSDFEWISKILINQPDYMFASQLQQDVDIEAQIESIRYYEDVISTSMHSSLIYSSILTRTVMDKKYFYGVRLEACRALSKYIFKPQEKFVGGSKHLIKIFQDLFCFEGSSVPKSNNFEDIREYLVQKRIVQCLGDVRNEHDEIPNFIKTFVLNLLKYNDNSGNFFLDHNYIREMIKSVVTCCTHDIEDKNYHKEALEQLNRYENLDKWAESYDFSISREIVRQKTNLMVRGIYEFNELNDALGECLNLMDKNDYNILREREGVEDLTLECLRSLLISGGIKNKDALTFFFESVCSYPDIFVRLKLPNVFIDALNYIVENRFVGNIDDDCNFVVESIIPNNLNPDNEDEVAAFIMDDISGDIYRKTLENKRKNIKGLIRSVRYMFRDYEPLKNILWNTLHTPLLNVYSRKVLFDLSRVLYRLENKLEVILPAPRMKKLIANHLGEGKVVIKRDGIMKLHIRTIPTDNIPSNKLKITIPPIKPKTIIKIKPKKPKNTIKKIGTMPIRFIKFSENNKKVDVSSVPFSKNVSFPKVNSRTFTVKIKYSKK